MIVIPRKLTLKSLMSYRKQIQTVFFLELLIIIGLGSFAYLFWNTMCSGTGWSSCIGDSQYAPIWFAVYSILRPLLATPIMIIALIAGASFGPILGTILAALGVTLSCLLIYLPAKYIGKIYVKPFLSANLPAMWRLMRTQDYKVAFITRWIPIFPFDLFSILFGVMDFRFKSVAIATFFGVIPECYMFARLSGNPTADGITSTISSLMIIGLAALGPLVAYEIVSRKRGSSLWNRIKSVYRELIFEIRANNEIVRRQEYVPGKIPVILLYGFFSSRRSLTVLERILQARGFQVMSFNLGGLFGVFFTRGIKETARFIDQKIERQIKRHGFQKVHIVAHSKGGLVAVWWLLKLDGWRVCDRLITMGTPFQGSIFTYLALVTPLGFIWKDVWQMRPGSEFLRELHNLPVPKETQIYCLFSEKDGVARGRAGMFTPSKHQNNIAPVELNHIGHFEFLYRRDVGDVLTKLLRTPPSQQQAAATQAQEQQHEVDAKDRKYSG